MHRAVRVADTQLRGVRAVHKVLHAVWPVRRQALVRVWHLLRRHGELTQQQTLQHISRSSIEVSPSPAILRQCTQLSRGRQLISQEI